MRRKPLEFIVGDRVLLKVSPWKGVVHFGKCSKLNQRYVGPFTILERIGRVAYRLELPDEVGNVHDVFHVFNLKKCLCDETLVVPLQELKIDDKLHFIAEPVEIMDREVMVRKHSRIPIVRVRWNSRRGPEFRIMSGRCGGHGGGRGNIIMTQAELTDLINTRVAEALAAQ
ncbi:uncharacterized protein LOC110913330 [Helianthus annuus]|uniref:uncharacterized protein LOC110913330 n=1 Tax=Helianthus annuus TaxID=4232 RepID=UPI000B8EFD8F|nr:uncharacterized protein LOC110913330 [Helianthus annuus]